MTDQIDEEVVVDELTELKQRADLMKIPYHPSIGLEKLREKVNKAIENQAPDDDGEEEVKEEKKAGKAKKESEHDERVRLRNEAMRLVRIRLTCMNPMKKEWNGEIFSVGNNAVGTIKKFVPFNAEEGWHVPHILYEMLRDRQCQVFSTGRTKNGVQFRQSKLIKEFAIEVLEPLSEEELHDLAQRQAMAKSID